MRVSVREDRLRHDETDRIRRRDDACVADVPIEHPSALRDIDREVGPTPSGAAGLSEHQDVVRCVAGDVADLRRETQDRASVRPERDPIDGLPRRARITAVQPHGDAPAGPERIGPGTLPGHHDRVALRGARVPGSRDLVPLRDEVIDGHVPGGEIGGVGGGQPTGERRTS